MTQEAKREDRQLRRVRLRIIRDRIKYKEKHKKEGKESESINKIGGEIEKIKRDIMGENKKMYEEERGYRGLYSDI